MKVSVLAVTLLCLVMAAPAFAGTIYDDGPTSGTYNGFFVDGPNPGPFSQWISNVFVATGSGQLGEMEFGLWVPTGSTPATITYWLGTTYLDSSISGGTPITLTPADYTYVLTTGNGYDVYEIDLHGLTSSMITAGNTYWLTLGNANDSFGSQFDAWDVINGPATCNFGVGQTLQGDCGAGGEAFTLSTAATPEPGTLVMLGTGVLGLAGAIRRKLF